MKLQIDTIAKTIKIEESVNLGELFEKIEKLFPNEWKEYKLEILVIKDWINPIIIEKQVPINPFWQQPNITYSTDTCKSKYNVEC